MQTTSALFSYSAASASGLIAALTITVFQVALPTITEWMYILRLGRLRWSADGSVVKLTALPEPYAYHLFLSHVWGGGNQEKMRVVKEKLLSLLPKLRIFLDVDDLTSGRGEDDVAKSLHVLVYLSPRYFGSVNCMRELLLATLHCIHPPWDPTPHTPRDPTLAQVSCCWPRSTASR
jgi:hypothetical protein